MALSMISLLFLFLLPVAVIVVIVTLVSRRKNGKGESFSRTSRLVYMYAVIIVSLFLTIGGAIFAWNNAVNLALPEAPNTMAINQELARQNQRNSAARGLSSSLAAVVVGATVFIYHSRKVKK